MMVVRMKVKYLLLLIALLVGITCSWLYFYPQYLLHKADTLDQEGKKSDALVYYQKVFSLFPYHPDAAEALFKAADMAPKDVFDGTVFIFPSTSFVNGSGEYPVSIKQGIEWLTQLQEKYPHSLYANFVDTRLPILYLMDGQTKKAEELNQKLKQRIKGTNEIERSLHYLQGDPATPPFQLSGTVRMGDQPVPGMHVYLIKLIKRKQHSFNSSGDGYPHVVTDQKGEYHFSGLEPGDYEVGVRFLPVDMSGYYWPTNYTDFVTIGAPLGPMTTYDITFKPQMKVMEPAGGQDIKGDQMTFRWQPQAGAAYYQVSVTSFEKDTKTGRVTGSFTSTIDGKFTDPQATLSMDQLRTMPMPIGVAYGGGPNGQTVDPSSVLGMVYPGGEFTWSVKAFDAAGNVLNSSAGNYLFNDMKNTPLFSVDDRNQLKGDRLLLAGKYEEAINAYKQEMENPYALRSLAVLALYNVIPKDRTNVYEYNDPKLAISYLEKLPKLLGRDVDLLGSAYQATGQVDKEKALYLKYPSVGSNRALAEIYEKEGHFSQAIDQFEQTLNYNNYASRDLLVLYLLSGDTEKALQMSALQVNTYWEMDVHTALENALKYKRLLPKPELHQAVRKDDLEAVKRLLTTNGDGKDPNQLMYEMLYLIATQETRSVRPEGELATKFDALNQQDPTLGYLMRTILSSYSDEWKTVQ